MRFVRLLIHKVGWGERGVGKTYENDLYDRVAIRFSLIFCIS